MEQHLQIFLVAYLYLIAMCCVSHHHYTGNGQLMIGTKGFYTTGILLSGIVSVTQIVNYFGIISLFWCVVLFTITFTMIGVSIHQFWINRSLTKSMLLWWLMVFILFSNLVVGSYWLLKP